MKMNSNSGSSASCTIRTQRHRTDDNGSNNDDDKESHHDERPQHYSPQYHLPLHPQQQQQQQVPHRQQYSRDIDDMMRPNGATRVWTHPSQQQKRHNWHDGVSRIRRYHPSESYDDSSISSSHRSLHHLRSPPLQQKSQRQLRPLVLDATASPSRGNTTSSNVPSTSTSTDTHGGIPPPQLPPLQVTSSSLMIHQNHHHSYNNTSPVLQQYPPMKLFPSPAQMSSSREQQHQRPPYSKSGFLYKLGVNIPIYKRRYFTLSSSSPSLFLLYYFISPHDTEPRGWYNIFNAIIEYDNNNIDFNLDINDDTNIDCMNDNTNDNMDRMEGDNSCRTYRFALVWRNDVDESEQRVELEARSKLDAIQWIQTIQKQQISIVAQQRIQQAQATMLSHQQQILALEKQISNFKYIEHERDDAMNDATQYHSQLQQLDESIRLITQQIRRKQQQQSRTETEKTSSNDDLKSTDDCDDNDEMKVEKIIEDAHGNDVVNTDIDLRRVPGNHFAALYNTVEQIQEQLRLVSMETVTAVDDVTNANRQIQTLQCRNEQMEQHLCQIWEENCSLRKSMKQIKKEKRILVKEVKSLRDTTGSVTATTTGSSNNSTSSATTINGNANSNTAGTSAVAASSSFATTIEGGGTVNQSKNFTEEFLNASDEDKLIQELEDHVLSSIRLHEEFLSSVPIMTTGTTTNRTSIASQPLDIDTDDENHLSIFASSDTTDDNIDFISPTSTAADQSTMPIEPKLHPNVPLFEQQNNVLPIVSLFDNDDDDDTDDDDTESVHASRVRDTNIDIAIGRSLTGDHHVVVDDELETDITTPTTNTTSKKSLALITKRHAPANSQGTSIDDDENDDDDMKDRPNPLLHLDNYDEYNNMNQSLQPDSSTGRSQVTSKQYQPTYQLSCPLTDAISTTTSVRSRAHHPIPEHIPVSSHDMEGEIEVYHITFYSRKIGIQFQKVPPTPIKVKGLLTEAMTDDLTTSTAGTTKGVAGTSSSTAAELRRIAAISKSSKRNHSNSKQIQNDICDVATPVDAVLVCGFHGFDESNRTMNCQRPTLGARLVAFDGVSIEIGRWTFSAVRKAIQSCDRPLTLSFRNDYLTKEQRTILTRAVLDVDLTSSSSSSERQRKELRHSSIEVIPDTHELIKGPTQTVMTDDMSESAGGDSDYLASFPQSFSGNRSVNSLAQYRSFYETRSYGSSSVGGGNDHKIRSFSEAGGSATTTTTSSSVLSAIGPLVSNLLYRPRRPSEPFTPEYLRRAPEFVEETPQHQDFQSELL